MQLPCLGYRSGSAAAHQYPACRGRAWAKRRGSRWSWPTILFDRDDHRDARREAARSVLGGERQNVGPPFKFRDFELYKKRMAALPLLVGEDSERDGLYRPVRFVG